MTIAEVAQPALDDTIGPRDDSASTRERAGESLLPPDEVYQHLVDALRQRDRKIADLEVALRSNRTIGVAIGILMATLKCPRDEAFSTLAVCSNTLNRKVVAVADFVEETGTLPGSPGDMDAKAKRRQPN